MGHEVICPEPTLPNKRRNATFGDYVALTRLDHSAKQIFIAPGIVFACLLRGSESKSLLAEVILGTITCICIASANYVINEYLDRDFDRHHPTKSKRRAVQTGMRGWIILMEWFALVAIGLTAALIASSTMFVIACIFGLQGIIYNAPPFRTKDKPYLDVISESVNNPIRLAIGWAMVDPRTLPPSSIILAYWLGGAFLMGAKRYSEYKEIVASHGRDLLIRYRASFAGYSEVSLLISCFIYGLLSCFFLALFLIKYRVEYLLMMPAAISMFGYYLAMAMQPNSMVQHPEKLFKDRKLVMLLVLSAVIFCVTTLVNLPWLTIFVGQRYIEIG